MNRRVVITGLGPVSALGLGSQATWQGVREGRCGIGPIQAFDPSGFACRIASEAPPFKIAEYVPKTYRKATKVMARDIELAVVAADHAARDAKLITRGTQPDAPKGDAFQPTDAAQRVGCHIGAGLIAAELNELAGALVQARDEHGKFDIHRWGNEGMKNLTPLWLLKYLPNMLACHVTIIHETQGPSNTITCGEASSHLSIGESLRVIQRGSADACFCGGADSRINPMAYLRQVMTGRLNTRDNDQPAKAVRPFCQSAAGTAVGEGGAILVLESLDSMRKSPREGLRVYGEIVGFGASQSLEMNDQGLIIDADGSGMALAIDNAMSEAGVKPGEIDLIVPYGLGYAPYDQADVAAMRRVFGDRLKDIALLAPKALLGAVGAGGGAVDVVCAAMCLAHQCLPAVNHCDQPLPGLSIGNRPARDASLRHVLTYTTSLGGQNAAMVLRRFEEK
ncbi:MAG: hypothetical protein IT440_09715 [Phycisphaeraceae bacterium]|nr:hypothetical protein [Phycisphaeraceae bacterium]